MSSYIIVIVSFPYPYLQFSIDNDLADGPTWGKYLSVKT